MSEAEERITGREALVVDWREVAGSGAEEVRVGVSVGVGVRNRKRRERRWRG